MKISTKGRYGLRAIIDIAQNGDIPLSIRDISKNQDLSVKYLEHIMKKLIKADLVKSVRGPKGGYVLSRPAKEITTGEILRALEGSISPTLCVGGERCEKNHKCEAVYVWKKLKTAIDNVVDNINLEEICTQNIEKGDI